MIGIDRGGNRYDMEARLPQPGLVAGKINAASFDSLVAHLPGGIYPLPVQRDFFLVDIKTNHLRLFRKGDCYGHAHIAQPYQANLFPAIDNIFI